MDRIDQARLQAFEWHKDQTYDVFPYSFHLMEVVKTLREFDYMSEELQIAGYLHDCIEDCEGVTREVVKNLFGEHVADLVWAVSGEGKTRKEKKLSMVQKLESFPAAIPLKMADRMANMRYSKIFSPKKAEMYARELSSYQDLFHPCNSAMYMKMYRLIL